MSPDFEAYAKLASSFKHVCSISPHIEEEHGVLINLLIVTNTLG
jgi:hypothetical protein